MTRGAVSCRTVLVLVQLPVTTSQGSLETTGAELAKEKAELGTSDLHDKLYVLTFSFGCIITTGNKKKS